MYGSEQLLRQVFAEREREIERAIRIQRLLHPEPAEEILPVLPERQAMSTTDGPARVRPVAQPPLGSNGSACGVA